MSRSDQTQKRSFAAPRLARVAGTAVIITIAWASHAQAQSTLTWSAGANRTWDTSSLNWNPGPATWTVNSNAVFDNTLSGTANREITVSGTQSLGTLTVSGTNYSFTGGALQYNQGTSGTWTFSQGATINSGLTATLTVAGSGTTRMWLTTTNNSTGGTLRIAGPVTLTGSGSGIIWFQPDGRFTFSGSNTLSNVGLALGFSNGRTYRFENSTTVITSTQTSGVNRGVSYAAGDVTIVSSTITTPSWLAGNGGNATTNMTSGLITTGEFRFNPFGGSNTSTLNLDGGTIEATQVVRDVNGASATTAVNLNFNGGTLRSRASSTNFINVLGGATTNLRVLAGGARIDSNGFSIGVPVSFVSGTTNDGGLTKLGSGTLTLSASNGYVGTTAINAGVLSLTNANALAGGGNVTFGGGALQFSSSNQVDYSGRIKSSGSEALIDTNGQSVTFAGVIDNTNTGGLTKLGSGTLALSGSNGYTGTTTISAGVLGLGNASALAGGDNVTFGGGTLQFSSSNQVDYSGRIKSSGSAAAIDTNDQSVSFASVIDDTNTGGLTKLGSGTLTLFAANTYTGTTTINGGVLAVGPNTQLGSAGVVRVAAGTLDLSSNNLTIRNLFNDVGQTSALVTNSGTGTVILSISGTAATSVSGTFYGTLADGPGGGKLGLSISHSVANVRTTLQGGTGGGTFSYSGPTTIGGGAGLATIIGVLSPNSAYAVNSGGALDMFGLNGTIGSLSGAGAVYSFGGSTRPTLSVGSLNTDTTFSGNITNGQAGTLVSINKIGTGILTLSGSNGYTGTTTVSAGVLSLSSANALAGTGTVTFSGGTLRFSSSNQVDYSGRIKNSGSAAAIDTNGRSVTFASAIDSTNTGGLTKLGSGTLALSGSNAYSGGTDVNVGTLTVNGSLGAGLVSVASAATLMGSGTIGGPVSILGGGIVAPGNSPGTLTVNDVFTLADASILNFEFNAQINTVGGGFNDLITGVTNLTLDGVLSISGSGDWTTVANDTSWRLFNYTGTLTNNILTIGTQPTLGTGQSFKISTDTAGQVNLVIVPEPTGLLLAAAGMAGAAWLVRRRRAA